ncbi:MAG: cyclic pyranopterin monophosphate synthase MoaC [Thermoprotei archaeon]|nr:MAG: cyclic pyranopterin monophosphate synthase MoaC [Thermoprotei archaeon]
MVEVSGKPEVLRIARAKGVIRLRESTIKRILEERVEKGDPLTVARVAAVMAVKKTPEIIPLCHPIPVTGVKVDFELRSREVEVVVEVKAVARTGVEMEALTGVTAALLAIWDMVKAYEKDERGQYPETEIRGVKVLEKVKGQPLSSDSR